MNSTFNERALKQRYNVGDRNGPISLLSPPLRCTLGLGILIAIAGGIWATLARLPLNVQGIGALLPVSTINSTVSGTAGTTYWMFNRSAEPWHKEARQFQLGVKDFSNQQTVDLSRNILSAVSRINSIPIQNKTSSSAAEFSKSLRNAFRGIGIPKGKMLLWIHSDELQERLRIALSDVERIILDSSKKVENILSRQKLLQVELKSRSSLLTSMKELEAKGFVSRASILKGQSEVDNLKSQILRNKNEILDSRTRRENAYSKLRDQLSTLINSEMIFAKHKVYLSQVVPNNARRVTQGQVVLELSQDRIEQPTLIPLFLSSREMAQVFPGMKVIATPSGYKRSEVGGIKGRVVSMAKVPSGLRDVASRVGLQSLAELILREEPAPTLAVVELELAGKQASLNSGGYRWSSSGALPFPPTPGDRLFVDVTTRYVAPIELAIPTMKKFFGIAPPEPLQPIGLGQGQ